MPRARRGGPSGPLKSVVTKGLTTSKKPARGLAGKVKSAQAKKSVPNRGSSRAAAAKARTAAQAGQKAGRPQRGPKETPLRASARKGKLKPTLKGKTPGVKRIKGAIITRRAGG